MSISINFPFTTDTNYTFNGSKIEVTGGVAKLVNVPPYATDDPTIECNTTFRCESLEGFVETATKTGSDEIKYILKKGSTSYYHNGASWVESNGTYAQANTAAEIETNKASFTSVAVTVTVIALLHSDDGSTTPELDALDITYDFAGDAADSVSKCIVWGYNKDTEGNADTSAFTIRLNRDAMQYKNNIMVRHDLVTVTPDSNGYWEIELIETVNMETDAHYIFDFTEDISFRKTVPVEDSKNFFDLTDYVEV